MQKISFLKKTEINKVWYYVDANGLIVGRLAVEIAKILMGKLKVNYTPFLDCGDNVIAINADKILFTGNKMKQKIYYKHTGYIGHLRQKRAKQIYESKFPERILQSAVKRMLGYGPMARARLKNLYLYCGESHPHTNHQPMELDLKQKNTKILMRG